MKKILVLIPTKDRIDSRCHKALLAQDYPNFEVVIYIQKEKELGAKNQSRNHFDNINRARNDIKKIAIHSDADYFMWLDSDIILPEKALTNLMLQLEQPTFDLRMWGHIQEQFPNKDIIPKKKHIISGWYLLRDSDAYNGARLIADNCMNSIKEPEASLTRVDKIDFGCMIVSREVFEKIDYKTGWNWKLNDKIGVCECFMFCKDADDLGYEMFMDGNVICKHKYKGKFKWQLKMLLKKLRTGLPSLRLPKRLQSQTTL